MVKWSTDRRGIICELSHSDVQNVTSTEAILSDIEGALAVGLGAIGPPWAAIVAGALAAYTQLNKDLIQKVDDDNGDHGVDLILGWGAAFTGNLQAWTPVKAPPPPPPPQIPNAPYGLSASAHLAPGFVGATANSVFAVQIYWMVSSPDDDSYALERLDHAEDSSIRAMGKFYKIADVAAHHPSTVGGNYGDHVDYVINGTEIGYRIRASNQAGTSDYSDILYVKIIG